MTPVQINIPAICPDAPDHAGTSCRSCSHGAGPRIASAASFHGRDEMGSLQQRQGDRLPIALQRAEAKTRALVHDTAAQPLIHASQGARTTAQRILWLQRAASAWARPLEAVAACLRVVRTAATSRSR